MEAMDERQAREFLAHNRFGVLALAAGGEAYALPLYYGYDGGHLYFHARPGKKDEFLEATQEACFVVPRVVTLDDWASVMAFGPVERVPEGQERDAAMDALLAVPLPPEWSVTETGEPARTGEGAHMYRLTIRRLSGRSSERPEMTEHEREMALGGM